MKIVIFDTETTSIDKPFCYNVGYAIYDTDNDEVLLQRDFVVEQVWHNKMLFENAYYKNKRPIYVSAMRGKATTMDKWGYIMRQMSTDFRNFGVEQAYAYNSNFDERVFEFNCNWYKTQNPLDTIPIYDIRGCVHNTIALTEKYLDFCEQHSLFTDSGNYSTTAESVGKYIYQLPDYTEHHTALADALLEMDILVECLERGCELGVNYKIYKSIPRTVEQVLKVVDKYGETYKFEFTTKTQRKNNIYLKG